MLLTVTTEVVEDVTEQIIYQVVPEAYQAQAMTFVGIVIGIVALYIATKPFLDNLRSKRQETAIRETAITDEQLEAAAKKISDAKDKSDTIANLANWRYKLLYATTEESKQMCNEEIARLEAQLKTYV